MEGFHDYRISGLNLSVVNLPESPARSLDK